MWTITLKIMKRNARMLVSAAVAILIGTAFIASTFLFANVLDQGMRTATTAKLGKANYAIVMDEGADLTGTTVQDASVGDFHLDRIAAIDGVKSVNPVINFIMTVSSPTGESTNVNVVNTAADPTLLAVSLTQGRQPRTDDEMALPASVAERLGLRVGDAFHADVSAEGGDLQDRMTLVGLTEDPRGAFSFTNGSGLVSDGTMARLYGQSDGAGLDDVGVNTIVLNIDPAQAPAATARIASSLPQGFAVKSVSQIADEASKRMSDNGLGFTTMFLLSFGVLAMLVASLVIANTFQVMVAQRRRALALLRTIGALRGQLYRSVLLEAGMLGLLSSALGIAVGIGLMAILLASGVPQAVGGSIASDVGVSLSWQVFVVPLFFGIAVTVLAAMGSARAATRVTPLEALRPLELADTRRSGRFRAILGWLTGGLGGALTGICVWQLTGLVNAKDGSSLRAMYPLLLLGSVCGCGLVFLALALTATFWMPILMRGLGAVVARIGPSSAVAHANVQKNPRRVGATGTALLIGVTLVCTMATGAAGVKRTMNQILDSHYSVDVVVSGPGVDERTDKAIAGIEGIGSTLYAPAATATLADAEGNETTVMLVGVDDVNALQSVMRTDLDIADLNGTNVLMPTTSVFSGEPVRFEEDAATLYMVDGDGGEDVTLPVTVTQRDYRGMSDYDLTAFVDAALFDSGRLKVSQHMVFASVNARGEQLSTVFDRIQSVVSKIDRASVTGPIAQRTSYEGIVNALLALMVGLLAAAVAIALIGVANTLSLSVIERRRECATLRAIGMTRGQVRRSLAVESLLIAMVGGLCGVVLGTLFGWIGTYVLLGPTVGTAYVVMPIDWVTDAVVLSVAAVAALMASVAPARRAVRTAPVEALAEA